MVLRNKFCLIILLFFATKSNAQDANYWQSDYGPGGFLTPGAVVANNKDSGVMFYNPALLAFANKSAASISGNIYQYQSIKIKDGIGTGLDLKSSGGSVIPLMASNVISLKLRKPFTIAYALINTPVLNYQVTQRKDTKQNVLDDSYSPGDEYYIGQYAMQNTVNETKGIFSIGFKLSPKLAAGLTMEGQLRKQNYLLSYSARALVNSATDTFFSQQLVNVQNDYQATYTHIGFRFKAGLSYDASENHHFGLLISSPLLHIGGSATMVSDEIINNLRVDSALYYPPLLANTRQTGLKTKYKLPLSIAFGYNFDFSDWQVYISAEYFDKVNDYNIITPAKADFIRPDTTNNSVTPALIKLKDAHKSLINYSLGISYHVNPVVTGYVSMRTDFNYADKSLFHDDYGYTVNTSYWNDYHFQVGANVGRRKFNLRAGLLVTYGSTNKFMQTVNYDTPHENNLLIGDGTLHNTKATHFVTGLMLSYVHNL